MKIRIELEESQEEEVIIRCHSLTEEVKRIQNAIADITASQFTLELHKKEAEFYVPVEEILFFETENSSLVAHTKEDIFETKYRLYELEELLPGFFTRVSKSTIVNVKEIYSLSKSNLSTTSTVAFNGSHKQVFVSRHYSKLLKEKLMEVRMKR